VLYLVNGIIISQVNGLNEDTMCLTYLLFILASLLPCTFSYTLVNDSTRFARYLSLAAPSSTRLALPKRASSNITKQNVIK